MTDAFWMEKSLLARNFTHSYGENTLYEDGKFVLSRVLAVTPDFFGEGKPIQSGGYVSKLEARVWVEVTEKDSTLKVVIPYYDGIVLPGFVPDSKNDPYTYPSPWAKQIFQPSDIDEALATIAQTLLQIAKNYLAKVVLEVPK